MKIKRLRRYNRAKYPRGTYRRRQKNQVSQTAKGGLTSLLIMALTDACEGVGVTGPPPVMPEMVTENEARQVIGQVFLDHGVVLQQDFPLVFRWAQDSLAFVVDGFNEGLAVGFEYVNPEGETPSFSDGFRTALDAAEEDGGPYIEIVDPAFRDPGFEVVLEQQILAFIERLKGLGII
jgi:hypothetical protein